MNFKLILANIQHIKELTFSIDLSKNQLMCIVGKNGVGKTTLIRAIKNLQSTDTFAKTASPYIFNDNSSIKYEVDEHIYDFKFNPKLQVIDTKSLISDEIKKSIYVELPIPHGDRFSHFQRLNEIDEALRESISLETYGEPAGLIAFLSKVYRTDRFNNLKEVVIKGAKYYFILKEDDFYIREDYLSSGEFFIINLYKMIQRKCKLIVIDEIDISLDSSAQVNLIYELRKFCIEYQVNIIFTTHSLALMKTLNDLELYYMAMDQDAIVTLQTHSYNYIKSILFGFKGWDRYILTEEEMLESYLLHLIGKAEIAIFFKYKIIYVGGAHQVVDLMKRNAEIEFFSSPENVISILDGDQKSKENGSTIICIPFESVEKQLFSHYKSGELVLETAFRKEPENPKEFYNSVSQARNGNHMSLHDIFSFINEKMEEEVEEFRTKIINFLSPS
ncbi:MAG: AAA family ATPase [Gammaproteobacteria bacterium]|nr:AAA family ATPase [Gammaproteobacteria bacterium]